MGIINTLKNMAAKKTVEEVTNVVEEVAPTVGCENCEFKADKALTCSVCSVPFVDTFGQ